MGLWIKTGGSVKDIAPQNGKDYKWHELKKYVNGYIEIVRLGDGKIIVCNEEGKLIGLPVNWKASMMCGQTIVGDVVLCLDKEVK